MALDNFKEVYSDRYQDVFNKVNVGKFIANFRFEPQLKYGESITRIKYDISGVVVRDIVNLTDRTVDAVTDSEQTLTVNAKKGTTFPIASHEKTQAGPLSPANVLGKQVAIKLSNYMDADILGECINAHADFDTGDLTTLTSTGVAITLSSTTVPQMVVRAQAKLRSNNITLTNIAWVMDSYGLSDISQYRLGKEIDTAGAEFRNGMTDANVGGAVMLVSENLTGEAVLGMATQPTANDTVTIQGVAFKFVASPSAAGDVDLGSDADESRLHLSYAINGTGTAGTDYIALATADRATLTANRVVATDTAASDILTIVCKGSGRLTVAETFTDGTDAWTKNFIHSYFGKKGAIDMVVQDHVEIELRAESKQRTDNVLSDALYGYKTFDDGAQQFLDVMISS
jgi:hypothetical protein